MLSERFTDHIQNPRNMGDMHGFNGMGEVTGDECGDMMTIYIKIDNGLLLDISFKTFGCWAAVAAASLITETIKGQPLNRVAELEADHFRQDLDEMYEEKRHCLVLVIDTINRAVNNYLENQATKGISGCKA